MSDPTEHSQRTPLSSSASHAGGTSALSVTNQPEPDGANSASAEPEAPAPDTPETDGATPEERAEPITPDDSAEAEPDASPARYTYEQATAAVHAEMAKAAPGDDVETTAEVTPWAEAAESAREINAADAESAESSQQGAEAEPEADSADDAAAFVAPEQPQAPIADLAPEAAAEPVEETPDATESEASAEIAAIGSMAETAMKATESTWAEMAETGTELADSAVETMENIGDSVADAAMDGLAAIPQAAEELRSKIRDNLARNDVHQDQALKLFQDVSQKFAVAFEEAGQDAARITFKMMEFAQANLQNNLHWAKGYAASRSVPELLDVQRAYLKRQFDLLNSQAEMLREMTLEMTTKSAAQLKKQASPSDDQSGPR